MNARARAREARVASPGRAHVGAHAGSIVVNAKRAHGHTCKHLQLYDSFFFFARNNYLAELGRANPRREKLQSA